MVGGPDLKVATVDVESGDNMATLPVSRSHTSTDSAEKNNAANKEMELKNVMPKPLLRCSVILFFYLTLLLFVFYLQKKFHINNNDKETKFNKYLYKIKIV